MIIEIPGYRTLEIKNLVLDYNGTIALDGEIPQSVKERLCVLANDCGLSVYVLTADTHGTARSMCEGLPLTIMTFPGDSAMYEKQRIIKELGADVSMAVGNGRNDVLMCREAVLSAAIIGGEGAFSGLIAETTVTVRSIEDALDLLIKPKRLIATLRG